METRISNDLITVIAIAGYAVILGIVYSMH
jgi:hypothetical protein